MSSDLCILLTDNEPGLFIMQALAAMPHGPIARDTRSALHYTTYSTMPCCTRHYDKNLIWSQ